MLTLSQVVSSVTFTVTARASACWTITQASSKNRDLLNIFIIFSSSWFELIDTFQLTQHPFQSDFSPRLGVFTQSTHGFARYFWLQRKRSGGRLSRSKHEHYPSKPNRFLLRF